MREEGDRLDTTCRCVEPPGECAACMALKLKLFRGDHGVSPALV